MARCAEPSGPGGATPADAPVESLRGIGPRVARDLAERGVRTVGDLLEVLPFRYEDRRRVTRLADARDGEPITAVGMVEDLERSRTRRRGLEKLTAVLDDGTARLAVVFFNRSWLGEILRPGQRILVHGVPRRGRLGLELHAPSFDVLPPGAPTRRYTGWFPVYEKLGPLTPRRLRAAIAEALETAGEIPDPLPARVRRRVGLVSRDAALRGVHRPNDETPPEALAGRSTPAMKRLAFDEFFSLELGLAIRRARRRAERRPRRYRIDAELRAKLAALAPFELTGAQRRVVGEIEADLSEPWPMNRLLMGDVGSGKTIVALMAMMIAVHNGLQAALMAPTEILAEQHTLTLQKLLLPHGLRVTLLTAGRPARERREARARIASGMAPIVVGTHALLSESVRFDRLGLVVIDEQHRFGVVQRADLVAKGARPDVLVMSATPIPRTLAMVTYGDLDISILDEKPPGRPPVRTVVRSADERDRVFAGLDRALAQGRRVYVVRPAVDEGARRGLKAAEAGLVEYRDRFPGARVALVHGRMKGDERRRHLEAFARGEIDILVATTVIEVGIDVPEASVMVVEDADRFGLAQLHQLRGRVGRGKQRSYCVYIASEGAGTEALDRLHVLERTSDGFTVAEEDLARRGPGQIAGTAQSGAPSFRVADLVRHRDVLVSAREEAFRLLSELGEEGLPPALRAEVFRRHGERLRLAETA